MSKITKIKFVTGLVRFEDVHLFQPFSDIEGIKEKFFITLVIPKSDKSEIKRLSNSLKETKLTNETFLLSDLKNDSNPLKDGDKSQRPELSNSYYLIASSHKKPGIVDGDLNPISISNEIYNGCYGRASIAFYPYKTKTKIGIGVELSNVQKIENAKNPSTKKVWLIEKCFVMEPFLGGRLLGELDNGFKIPKNVEIISYSQDQFNELMEAFHKKNGHYPDE
jgi:hypothetical protein